MAKMTLEFDIEEEKELMNMHIKGPDYFSALFDIDNRLRNFLKHGGHSFTTPEDVMEYVREQICERVDLFE